MLEILIGNIASGKSTYCKEKAKYGCLIINDDDIVNMLHAHQYQLYSEKYKPVYKSIENAAISSALSLGIHVIVDRGINLTKKSRRRFIGLAHSLDTKVIAVVFPFLSPETHANRRYYSDSRGHDYQSWLEAAKRMQQEYEIPTFDEGFDEIVFLP